MTERLLKVVNLMSIFSLTFIISVLVSCSDIQFNGTKISDLEAQGKEEPSSTQKRDLIPVANEDLTKTEAVETVKEEEVKKEIMETIKQEDPKTELLEILNKATPEEKREFIKIHLDVKKTEGKDVKVCFWYKYEEPYRHGCNKAIFNVFFNEEPNAEGEYDTTKAQARLLNLNNHEGYNNNNEVRTHVGISGKVYNVPDLEAGGLSMATDCVNKKKEEYGGDYNQVPESEITECKLKYYPLSRNVPGTLYTAHWNREGKLNIVTTCALPECHNENENIANMSVIGKIVVNYKGSSAELTFVDRNTHLRTKTAVTYDIANQDFEIVSVDKTFDDWCGIIEPNEQ